MSVPSLPHCLTSAVISLHIYSGAAFHLPLFK